MDRRRQTYGTVSIGSDAVGKVKKKPKKRKVHSVSQKEAQRIRTAVEALERNEAEARKKRAKQESVRQATKREEKKRRWEEAQEAQRLKREAQEKRRQEAAILRQLRLEGIRQERERLASAPSRRTEVSAKGRAFVVLRKTSGRTPMDVPADFCSSDGPRPASTKEPADIGPQQVWRSCQICAGAIERQRLQALPETNLCAACALELVQQPQASPEASKARLSKSDIERLRAKQDTEVGVPRIAWPARAPQSCPRCGAPTEIRGRDRQLRVVISCVTGKRCGWSGQYRRGGDLANRGGSKRGR